MNPLLQKILNRYQKQADDDGSDLPGGDADYGDDFTPTDDGAEDVPAAKDDAGDEPAAADEDLRAAAEELEEGAEEAKKTGTPKSGKGKFIPLDRHEKLLKKERARREELEAQLSQSRAGQQMAQANEDLSRVEDELVAMEAKYNDLLAEGDTQTAAQLMTQIRRKNAELSSITAAHRDAEVMARAVEKVRFDEALDRIEEAYPELDPESGDYDEDTYQDVYDLMMAGRQRGLSATKALQRAVARVMGAETTAQKRATTATPRVDENDVASRRRGEAVRRNLDAARRTPPATHRISANNDAAGGALTAKAVMSMSEDDFEKLSDKDLARLRGDVL